MDDSLTELEQAQLKLALALSLEQPSTSASTSTSSVPKAVQAADAPILISSSSDEAEPENEAVDGSETELSDVEEVARRAAERKKLKRKREGTTAKNDDRGTGSGASSSSKRTKLDIGESAPSDVQGVKNEEVPSDAPKKGAQPTVASSRADMEKERLARMAAREASSSTYLPTVSVRSTSNVTSTSNAGKSKIATLSSIKEPSPEAAESAYTPNPSTSTANHASSSSRFGSLATLEKQKKDRRYWNGICRPTSSSHHSGYECFKFSDVIGETSELQSALLATFCGDPQWIISHFPDHVKVALVMPMQDAQQGQQIKMKENFLLINPRREADGRGCMHIKLVLLYYKTFLRVAVATANLIDYDWSTIENAVYIHDFPRLSDTSASSAPSPFLSTLLRTHQSLGTPSGLYKTALLPFDFSSSSHVRLVLSIPGNYKSPSDISRNGHTGLSTALQELHLDTPAKNAKLSLECQGSSTGAYTIDWLRTVYRSMLGWDPLSLSAGKARSESSKRKIPWKEKELPELKIVFPTLKTVTESLNGTHGGGTIFCDLKNWNKKDYPRELFVDSRSQREGLLQHTKMILGIVRPAKTETPAPFFGQGKSKNTEERTRAAAADTPIKKFGWLYVGSHNFTPAAWGRYSEKSANLSISNHELGVIIPLSSDDPEEEAQKMITWKRPVSKYGKDDLPWDQFDWKRKNGGGYSNERS